MNTLRKVVNFVHLHLAAAFAAFASVLFFIALSLAASLRKREAAQADPTPAPDVKDSADRTKALGDAQALADRRKAVEAEPLPQVKDISGMDAQGLADEWARMNTEARTRTARGVKNV